MAPRAQAKRRAWLPALLNTDWINGRKIILLSPRRLAARAAASRMAFERGEPVGATVGYRVRLDSKISRETRIEVVTEGVFTRMILDDPNCVAWRPWCLMNSTSAASMAISACALRVTHKARCARICDLW